jgi:hypothetical protein
MVIVLMIVIVLVLVLVISPVRKWHGCTRMSGEADP